MHKFDLKNRTAVITGGAQGFGFDIAKKFLNSGANVIIWDIDENELQNAIKKINNSKLSYNVVDISNFEKVNQAVIEVNKKTKSRFFLSIFLKLISRSSTTNIKNCSC